jgi:hypothetical protein
LGLIERYGFLLSHGGKKEGTAEGLSGVNRLLDKTVGRRKGYSAISLGNCWFRAFSYSVRRGGRYSYSYSYSIG